MSSYLRHYVEVLFIPNNHDLGYAEYEAIGKGLASFARVSEDGRIVISLDLRQKLPDLPKDYAKEVNEFAVDAQAWRDVPRLNIVIMIVGSRGELLPYERFRLRLC